MGISFLTTDHKTGNHSSLHTVTVTILLVLVKTEKPMDLIKIDSVVPVIDPHSYSLLLHSQIHNQKSVHQQCHV